MVKLVNFATLSYINKLRIKLKDNISILHRINKVKDLKTVDPRFGVEMTYIFWKDLILSHPFKRGDKLDDYLAIQTVSTLILNIKEKWN